MVYCAGIYAKRIANTDLGKIVVFDTETTGLRPLGNEILQITLVDGYGSVLFSSYIKPRRRKSWKGAERINHISPEMVANAPAFSEVKKELQAIFNRASIVAGYNLPFDISFVENEGIVLPRKSIDVMQEFRKLRRIKHGIMHNRNSKLIECAEYFGVSFSPHDATEDAQATAACLREIIADPVFLGEKVAEKEPYRVKKTIQIATRRKTPVRTGLFLCVIAYLIWYLFGENSFTGLIVPILIMLGLVMIVFGILRIIVRSIRRLFGKLLG